jgi:hypothetical protein
MFYMWLYLNKWRIFYSSNLTKYDRINCKKYHNQETTDFFLKVPGVQNSTTFYAYSRACGFIYWFPWYMHQSHTGISRLFDIQCFFQSGSECGPWTKIIGNSCLVIQKIHLDFSWFFIFNVCQWWNIYWCTCALLSLQQIVRNIE